MIDTVVVNVAPGETRIASLAAGRVLDVRHRRAGLESLAGNLYLGRVTRVAPGLQAAFIDIGAERPGFLNAADARPRVPGDNTPAAPIGAYVREGEAVVVQVSRDAVGDKGARLGLRPTLVGRRLVFTPGVDAVTVSRRIGARAESERLAALVESLADAAGGFVVRTAAEGAPADDIAREAGELRALWREIEVRAGDATAPACLHDGADPLTGVLRDHAGAGLTRVVVDSGETLAALRRHCARFLPDLEPRLEAWRDPEPVFEAFGVEAALDEALAPWVALPSGGRLTIEETEALVAIDVDAGAVSGGDFQSNLLRANVEAAAEIARQLRLRALGGLIVIDFARMTRVAHQREVIETLRSALADDRDANPPAGFTRLGLVEMTRRRTRPSLAGLLCDPRAGRGLKTAASVVIEAARAALREARATAAGSLALRVAPEVARAFETGAVLDELRRLLGGTVDIRAEDGRGREDYDIVAG